MYKFENSNRKFILLLVSVLVPVMYGLYDTVRKQW